MINCIVVSWGMLQVASIIFRSLEINEEVMKFLIILLLFDLYPGLFLPGSMSMCELGFRKTEEIPLEKSITQFAVKRMNTITIAKLFLAMIHVSADCQLDFTGGKGIRFSENSLQSFRSKIWVPYIFLEDSYVMGSCTYAVFSFILIL